MLYRAYRHSLGSRERDGESGYLSLRRAGSRSSLRDNSPPPPYRHLEVGHPLPSTRSPEPKASIPFRNRDLGVPSKRRNSDSSNEPLVTSPPKYSQHSNFRRSPRSPSPYTPSPRTPSPNPHRHAESLGPAHRRGSHSQSSSNHQSRHSRRGSVHSRSSSPSRSPSPFRHAEHSGSSHWRHFDSEEYSQGCSREHGSHSQSSHRRGLDSERLYKNLNSIASAADFKEHSGSPENGSRSETEMNATSHRYGRDSRNPSPSRRGYDTRSHSVPNKTTNNKSRGDVTPSYSQKTREGRAKTDPGLTPGSWGGSTLSLCSPDLSQGSSPPRRGPNSQLPPHLLNTHPAAIETDHRCRSSSRRAVEARSPSPEYRRSPNCNRSPSPPVRGHMSSQSSLESEAFHVSGGSDTVLMVEEYVEMADIPKTKPIYMREGPKPGRRSQSYRTERKELHEPARYSQTMEGRRTQDDSRERGRGRERGRDRRERRDGERGRPDKMHSSASHQRSSSPHEEDVRPLSEQRKQTSQRTQTQKVSQVDRGTGSHSSSYQTDLSEETLNEKACNL
ncbi:hypothetical protein JZ751_025244 [Albula glossodonta]|uniref:Uncharacterized protein n=1 Tax=Albula glossodonta TaxID=121402 RepID=A0A8T2NR27_9TELE|nr:hypothetical protein JZ751_025244 [Albula glossodonta]